MNKKCKLIKSLLNGDTINVSNSIRLTSYSNPAREIPRCIEIPFGVVVDKIKKESTDQYGHYITWKDYKLSRFDPKNVLGVEKMRIYLSENMEQYRPKQKEKTIQQNIFSEL